MNVERYIVPIGVVTVLAAAIFLAYGTWAGLVQRRILARAHGTYNTGRRAVIQGLVYVVIGLWFLVGGMLEIAAGLAAVEEGTPPVRPLQRRVLRAAIERPRVGSVRPPGDAQSPRVVAAVNGGARGFVSTR